MGKREDKKADLKRRLVEAAEAQILEHGLSGLKAREVTTAAGCALGALYTAFEDLDMLVIEVNARTLRRLGAALHAACPESGTPEQVLQALARAYVGFAGDNTALWSALFEHRLPEGRAVPEWYREEHGLLIAEIVGPLRSLRPDLDADALRLRAQSTFAAVHGVVQLALQGRFVGVPRDRLEAEVAALVSAMIRGSQAGA